MNNNFLRAGTALYILLPSFLFIYGWLKLPFAIIALVILASFTLIVLIDVFRIVSNSHMFCVMKTKQNLSRLSSKGFVLAILLITLWLAFSGVGGVGFQNADYSASNALLKDLITQDWPLKVTFNGTQVPVVYYVGYYLPSAIIGKTFGWVSANIFLFMWTLVGVLLAFVWFWKLSRLGFQNRGIKLGIFITQIFCLAGGLDYIGYYLFDRNVFNPIAHIEPWASYFQYSSNTTLIYWVPQQTIAAWLVMGVIVDALYDKHNLKYLGMVVAAGIIWSPFGIVGAVPYLLMILYVYLQSEHRKYLFNWESIVFNTLSIGIGAIYLLYLGSNQFKFPIGFIWQFTNDIADLVVHLLAFWCLEFALMGFLILLLIVLGIYFSHPTTFTRHDFRKWIAQLDHEFHITPIQLHLFLVSLIVLGVLPLFKMGIRNDLAMRGSIASLFIFWAFVTKVIADTSVKVRMKFKWVFMLFSIILTTGFLTSFNEIARSATVYHFGPPVLSDVLTTSNANEGEIVLQRIGNEDSIFYRYLGK